MADNLLNIGLYVKNSNEQMNAPKKSYLDNADSALNFDKVFDSANKVYNADRTSFNAASNYNKADSSSEKENFNDIGEKKSYEDSSRIKEKNDQGSKSEDASNKSKDTEGSDDSKKSEEQAQNAEGAVAQEAVAPKTMVDALTSQAIAMLTKDDSPKAETAEVATPTAQVAVAQGAEEVEQNVQTTPQDKKIEVDVTKLTQDPKALAEAKNLKSKVQAEVQQLLLKIEPEKNVAQEDLNALNVPAEAKAQGPLIQVAADVAANVVAPKKVLVREMLEKAILTQEMLDKTNATVVGVETSASSGNLLNQQNAKEQGVKMSLTSVDTNLGGSSSVTGANGQVTFDKKLEVVQAPKEINKSEVLSQIHAKLDNIKDEGTTKVTIVLKPENLGKINLELINGKDGFTARMTADNAQVKELLDKNLDSLKSSLASQGVNVGSVTVKVADAEKSSTDMFAFDQRQQEAGDNMSQSNSNGSHNQGESQGGRNPQRYFEEEIVNNAQSANSDDSGSRLSHDGQVDYKI